MKISKFRKPEITFFDNLYDILVILKIITEYQSWDRMSHMHYFSMLGDFSPARMVGGRVTVKSKS